MATAPAAANTQATGSGKKNEQKTQQQQTAPVAAQQLCEVVIDGPSDGVRRAAEQLEVLAKRLENEASRDLSIEARLHRLIIGSSGAGIRVLSQKFPDVRTVLSCTVLSHQCGLLLLRGDYL